MVLYAACCKSVLANIQLKACGPLSEAVHVSTGHWGNVTLVDCDLSSVCDAALWVAASGSLLNLVLRGCRLDDSLLGLSVNTQATVRLGDCTIEDTTSPGVYDIVSHGPKATLSGCTITRNTWGVTTHGEHTEVTLENNNLSGNTNGTTCTSHGGRIIVCNQSWHLSNRLRTGMIDIYQYNLLI